MRPIRYNRITMLSFMAEFLLLAAWLPLRRAGPPTLSVSNQAEVVSPNDNLTLTCVGDMGDKVLCWHFVSPFGPEKECRETNKDAQVKPASQSAQEWTNEEGRLGKNLTLTGVQIVDLGIFWCTPCNNNFQDVRTSVYVYVNDSSNLFASKELSKQCRKYFAVPTQLLHIPCRTTSPDLRVTLWSENPERDVTNLLQGVIYDHRFGFFIPSPPDLLRGELSCRTRLGNFTDKFNVFVINLGIDPPVIKEAAVPYLVFKGPLLNLVCLGRYPVTWSIDIGNQMPNVIHEKAKEVTKHVTENGYYAKSLIVLDPVPALTGHYICSNDDRANDVDLKGIRQEDIVFIFFPGHLCHRFYSHRGASSESRVLKLM